MSNGRLFLDVNAVGPAPCMGMPRGFLEAWPPSRCRGTRPRPGRARALLNSGFRAAAERIWTMQPRQSDRPFLRSPMLRRMGTATLRMRPSQTQTPCTKVAPHLRDAFHYSVDEKPPAPWKSSSPRNRVTGWNWLR